MTPFKFFWICSSIILISGCSGLQNKPYSFSNQNTDFMTEYCQSGKQKKSFKTTVIYFTPPIEAGLPVDKANQKSKKLAEQKDKTLKSLFYTLSDSNMSEPIANHGDEPSWYLLAADDEKDVLENIKQDDSSTKYRLFTFVIKILNQNKIVIYQSNLDSRRMNYNQGYSTDLRGLMDDYTILIPREMVEEITGSAANSNEIDISGAISNKNNLWRSYIKRFTSIKEASEDHSRKSTIELALDLNIFCNYGRKISDLQSH